MRNDIGNPDRRRFGTRLAGVTGAAALATIAPTGRAHGADGTRVHRHEQSVPFPVNAYIVEGPDGLVVVDATLTVDSSRALAARAEAIGKPLRAVLLTHPHPDHYAGLGELIGERTVPIVAVEGVDRVVRRDDAAKDALIGGMFGERWPSRRVFPDRIVREGETLDFGTGLRFDVLDIGPAESYHDSVFVLEGESPVAFAGDLAYGLMHAYMADNPVGLWHRAIERLQAELSERTVLYIGHGQPVTPGFLAWQDVYLERFEQAIERADGTDEEAIVASVTQAMQRYLPSDELLFLMQLSVAPAIERDGDR